MTRDIDALLTGYDNSRLRTNPPATEDEIEAMRVALGSELPEEIFSLYRHHNGEEAEVPTKPFRLMSTAEVIDVHTSEDRTDFGAAEHGVRVFWIDDMASDYAGVYVEGTMAGSVCIVAHEETDFAPRYRSVASFLEALFDALPDQLDWQDMKTDYPEVAAAADPESIKRDRAAVKELKKMAAKAKDPKRRAEFEQIAISLIPRAYADSILAYTHSEDMWVQERACNVLGFMKHEPAIDRLAEVAVSGTHNGKLAAIIALGRINTDHARARLADLKADSEYCRTYGLYIDAAIDGYYT